MTQPHRGNSSPWGYLERGLPWALSEFKSGSLRHHFVTLSRGNSIGSWVVHSRKREKDKPRINAHQFAFVAFYEGNQQCFFPGNLIVTALLFYILTYAPALPNLRPQLGLIRLQMLTCFSTLAFSLGFAATAALQRCPSLTAPLRGTLTCSLHGHTVSCSPGPPPYSIANFTCSPFFVLSPEGSLECRSDGTWSAPPPKCVPDCGRKSGSVALIVNGVEGRPGELPWHVGMYYLTDGTYEYWCGGSLVSETAVLTAAHCVWGVRAEFLVLAFGKMEREYLSEERNVEKIKALRVEMLDSYQDVEGNYNGDIAVVVLERPVRVGPWVAPICVDWGREVVRRQIVGGNMGMIGGWGLTERETLSEKLRVVRLPVVSEEKCILLQEKDFRKYVTYTSFCAGFGNGTGVCNGDSGGGMAFFDEESGRWYLQGLVSVSPRKRGTPYCDPNFYTVFTKVAMFTEWLQGMKHLRRTLRPRVSSSKHFPSNRFSSLFQHTPQMIRLANLSALPPH